MRATISFDVYLKGSGAAGTPPEWGDLIRACGFSETITAVAVPAAPEALAAGTSTIQATLGTSASTTPQIYRGMPIVFAGAVSLTSLIWDYTAAKLAKIIGKGSANLTTGVTYQIPPNVVYRPASAGIPALTLYVFIDGLRRRYVGCRGNVSVTLAAGGPGRLSFTFTGIPLGDTDTANPVPVFDATRPQVWRGGQSRLNNDPAAVSQLQVDFGAQTGNPENPEAAEGFDVAEIFSRRGSGSMDPEKVLVATRDTFGLARTGARVPIGALYGTGAGERVGLTLPQAHLLPPTIVDRNGVAAETVPFQLTGQDAGGMIAIW
jgi:hypothetical protein